MGLLLLLCGSGCSVALHWQSKATFLGCGSVPGGFSRLKLKNLGIGGFESGDLLLPDLLHFLIVTNLRAVMLDLALKLL